MSRRHRSVVAVLSGGLSLSLAACSGKETVPPPGNPPMPTEPAGGEKAGPPAAGGGASGAQSGRTPGDHPLPTANPPPPPQDPPKRLPVWDEVESGHPEGATNPPRPVLVVLEDQSRCWKEWQGGMVRPDEEVMKIGGKIIADPAQTTGTEIECPIRRVQSMMDRKAAAEAGQK